MPPTVNVGESWGALGDEKTLWCCTSAQRATRIDRAAWSPVSKCSVLAVQYAGLHFLQYWWPQWDAEGLRVGKMSGEGEMEYLVQLKRHRIRIAGEEK